jgi:hypothetical protein
MSEDKNEFVTVPDLDNQALLLVAKTAVDETGKLFGPIFTRMVSEYALQFEVSMLKEKPPENIKGLEEVTKYIIANLSRYPPGYCSLFYGIAKAESRLQGSTGSGAKRSAFSGVKAIIESSGLLNSVVGTTENVFEAFAKSKDIFKATKTLIQIRYTRGENNQVTLEIYDCPYKDVCRIIVEEGVTRFVGGLECINLITLNAAAEIITKKQLDYRLDEFDEPNCRGRIFEV